ncbi:MAG TPA: RDD family protein [Opitutaceae bacterium]|nr:RDD family protein [Opitutaceae bacterium]
MNNKLKTLTLSLLLAALIPFAPAAFAADPEKSDAAATPTPALREVGTSKEPAAAAAPAPTASPAAAAAPAATAAPETPLHEVGASAAAAAAVPAAEASERPRHRNSDEDDRVSVGGATYVGAKETVEGNAVAVMGSVTVDGTVNGNAVAVMGTNTINGTVRGNAVAVLGDLNLGPKARLDGNAVSVGGRVNRDPSAIVGGNIVQQMTGMGVFDHDTASSWWKHGLSKGRPLAFGPHLHLLWIASICTVAFYILLALVFPGGIRKCADTLQHRPGITFLTGILSILGMPVLFVLLLVTVVGIPVALVVLPLSVVACVAFGKAAVYSLVGRTIMGKEAHPALAVVLGVAVMLVLYLIPVLGLMLWFLVGFLGFACALTALFTSTKPAPPAGTPPGAPAQQAAVPPAGTSPAAAAQLAAVPAAVVASASGAVPPPAQPPLADSVPPAASPSVPPVVSAGVPLVAPPVPLDSEAGYAKAGFWIRMAALLVDVILVGIIFHHVSVLFMPAIAVYGAVLWKFKGATIGGIVFGLKTVRADGRPMDWATAVVRALACYLSLVVVGLGFLWIAFDPEKRGWHDKIAGTVVVRLPKGLSLV